MLATLVDAAFDRQGWLFELKWDGYRAIAEVAGGRAHLYSRNGKPFDDRFAPVARSLSALRHDAVLDGEIVVVDHRGRSGFQLLQNYQRTGEGTLLYYVFDLLYVAGHDLRALPLIRRKAVLARLVEGLPHVRVSEHVEDRGRAFYRAAVAQGLEGIVAKNAASRYTTGMRSQDWLKVKARQRQEAVIAGFTEPRGARQHLGALVLGVYEQGKLTYIGHTGGGLRNAELTDLKNRMLPWIRATCPFSEPPATNAPVHWIEPVLVCEVQFQEWTHDGRMRQPVFLGLRPDKAAGQVHREREKRLRVVKRRAARPRRLLTMQSAERRGTAGPSAGRPAPVLTNLSRVYWPAEGYTKGDLIAYYGEMAPWVLPYLKDRPLSLHRHPARIRGPSFFQKDVSRQPPPAWVTTARISSERDRRTLRYLVCQEEASLLYVANLGCIELNPWSSRLDSLDQPDYLILDLDPNDIAFERVVEAARTVRQVLEQAGAVCFCKTSGKRGLHVCVPLAARYDYEQARQFAELVALLVHRRLPDTTSVVRRPAWRRRRVYLDFLQNRRGATLAAPYSARPWPGATVSTPLRRSEVRRGLDPGQFTIRTVPRRVHRLGDLWAPLLTEAIDLADCLRRLSKHAGAALPVNRIL